MKLRLLLLPLLLVSGLGLSACGGGSASGTSSESESLFRLEKQNYQFLTNLITVAPSGFIDVKISKIDSSWGYYFVGFETTNGLGNKISVQIGNYNGGVSYGYVQLVGKSWYPVPDSSGYNNCPGSMPTNVCVGDWTSHRYTIPFPKG